MKDSLRDVCSALKTMGSTAWCGMKGVLLFCAVLFTGISVVVLGMYFLHEYLWQTLAAVVVSALLMWFLIEVDNARQDREHQEESNNHTEGAP